MFRGQPGFPDIDPQSEPVGQGTRHPASFPTEHEQNRLRDTVNLPA